MINPQKVCTFYSTAAFSLCAPENVDIYSKDFNKLIFANPNQNMGNIAYVDIEVVYGHRPFNWKKIPYAAFYQKNEKQRDK